MQGAGSFIEGGSGPERKVLAHVLWLMPWDLTLWCTPTSPLPTPNDVAMLGS